MSTKVSDILLRIISQFDISGEFVKLIGHKSGHINDTYLSEWSTPEGTKRYIHQRVNHYVFKNVPLLMENISIVTRHVDFKIQPDSPECTLKVIPTLNGSTFCLDEQKNFWRTYNFIEDTQSYDFCLDKEMALEAGQSFGRFLHYLQDLPVHLLRETIPSFQSTTMRYKKFHQVLSADKLQRVQNAKEEIAFTLEREEFAGVIDRALSDGKVPKRVTHNDMKLNNLLFASKVRKGICVVDLDTCMPGTALFDFGDFMTNIAVMAAEDEKDLSKVKINDDILQMAIKGFISGAQNYFTPAEFDLLPFAPRVIALNLGTRFLADYLDGDLYFKVYRDDHNLDRCRTRFQIVREMEKREEMIRSVIKSFR